MGKRSHADPRGRASVDGGSRGSGVTVADEALRASMLDELLQFTPIESGSGLRVLEIGTDPQGGGTAVALADRAGGSVVSISQSSVVVSRARAAHAADGRLVFRRASYAAGWPPGGPYDLVLSWQLMDRLPQAWVAQCAAGGRVLSLVFVSHSEASTGLSFVRVIMNHDGIPQTAVATPHTVPQRAPGNGRSSQRRWRRSATSYNVVCT